MEAQPGPACRFGTSSGIKVSLSLQQLLLLRASCCSCTCNTTHGSPDALAFCVQQFCSSSPQHLLCRSSCCSCARNTAHGSPDALALVCNSIVAAAHNYCYAVLLAPVHTRTLMAHLMHLHQEPHCHSSPLLLQHFPCYTIAHLPAAGVVSNIVSFGTWLVLVHF